MPRLSDPDRMAVAELSGHVAYCREHRLPLDEAVASLREISARPDLLAEVAGIAAGAADRSLPDWPMRLTEIRLLLAAGADRSLLLGWMREGRRRRKLRAGPFYVEPDDLEDVLREVLDGAPGAL